MNSKKLLFIDRDGCLIEEPLPSRQIDSYDKLRFLPGALYALARLVRETDYTLVMVTNQDGMGTPAFPEDTFWPAHNLMMHTLESVGVTFKNVHIDRSYAHENLPTRKPGIGMLTEYLSGDYDLANSYVIGDRLTDAQLAQNLGARAILVLNAEAEKLEPGMYDPAKSAAPIEKVAHSWYEVYEHLRLPQRRVHHRRKTKETDIEITLNLDGTGKYDIKTGLAFFDHMLEQLARHGGLDLDLVTRGDLHIDEHHTIEDTALALGEAFSLALADKRGMARYGSYNPSAEFLLPMDDALARAAIDFGGRNWLIWEAEFEREKIGDMPTEMFFHFFKSFTDTARCNLNLRVEGKNEHHKIESLFKAFARAINMAVKRDPENLELPSTKGIL
ncbi:MAG: bifunctional histidinol-phosphatase/imidazoleglycerol-phosphate dehydratase HisB [Saprospiraceae bacterium]|nr:bifunctional histidinol-phosphatase/imidazoleglycerol-phosphate dehydratase HisB [Saprospiraceae bacterium]